MVLQTLVGAGMGVAVVAGGATAVGGNDTFSSWDPIEVLAFGVLAVASYGVGCAAGATLVGNVGDATGSFGESLKWAELGILAGIPLGGVGGILLSPIGATLGFNSSLRYKTPTSTVSDGSSSSTGHEPVRESLLLGAGSRLGSIALRIKLLRVRF
jgi:hypothetical protein